MRYHLACGDPLVDSRDDNYYAPRSRTRATLAWNQGDWNATCFTFRQGSHLSYAEIDGCYPAPNTGVCYSRRIAPWTTHNFTVGRKFGPAISTQFDIVNVFDNQGRHDESAPYPYYDGYVGSDFRGRRFNFSVSYRF